MLNCNIDYCELVSVDLSLVASNFFVVAFLLVVHVTHLLDTLHQWNCYMSRQHFIFQKLAHH